MIVKVTKLRKIIIHLIKKFEIVYYKSIIYLKFNKNMTNK